MEQRRTQLMRWWKMSRSRQVELLKAWLIMWMPKRPQIKGLLLASRIASPLQKCAWLSHLLGTEQVGGSVMDNIFGGSKHSIVMEPPSLLWCQVYSFFCCKTGESHKGLPNWVSSSLIIAFVQ
ncbi:unnamed protein product [Prunus armeniaca]